MKAKLKVPRRLSSKKDPAAAIKFKKNQKNGILKLTIYTGRLPLKQEKISGWSFHILIVNVFKYS
jgi:hypothetical protein